LYTATHGVEFIKGQFTGSVVGVAHNLLHLSSGDRHGLHNGLSCRPCEPLHWPPLKPTFRDGNHRRRGCAILSGSCRSNLAGGLGAGEPLAVRAIRLEAFPNSKMLSPELSRLPSLELTTCLIRTSASSSTCCASTASIDVNRPVARTRALINRGKAVGERIGDARFHFSVSNLRQERGPVHSGLFLISSMARAYFAIRS
jgi:hypothetical protein